MNVWTRTSRALFWPALFSAAIGLSACSDATGSLVGGDTIGGATTSTEDAATGGGGEGGALQYFSTTGPCAASSTDDTWSFLYGCYFAPTGVASCSFSAGNCHGTSGEPGAQISGGYVCGSDSTACWTTMNSVLIGGVTDPPNTMLWQAIRGGTGGINNMPLMPTNVTFESGDLSRLSAWITAGAKND
jgi:hypothetical protein